MLVCANSKQGWLACWPAAATRPLDKLALQLPVATVLDGEFLQAHVVFESRRIALHQPLLACWYARVHGDLSFDVADGVPPWMVDVDD